MNKKGYYREIPVIVTELTEDGGIEAEGINWFWNILFELNLWWDTYIIQVEEYPFYIEED